MYSFSKAVDRPDLVKRVVQKVKKDGLWSTFKVVSNIINQPNPLGYSLVGIVEEIGEGVNDISVGDRVACSGQGYANHAELVTVPIVLLAVADVVFAKPEPVTDITSPGSKP